MRNEAYLNNEGATIAGRLANFGINMPKKAAVGTILMVSLLAFEIFNFDTTRYALRDLLGDVRFLGLQWAGILAIAFCSIDFAGLVRIFTPQKGKDEPKEVWYLMGAWLLGATMNATMTWWAVSLTLLNHDFGNEVLSREQLLQVVPIFVAILVWLTRILFIGAFTVAGEHIFDFSNSYQSDQPGAGGRVIPATQPVRSSSPRPTTRRARPNRTNQSTSSQRPSSAPTSPASGSAGREAAPANQDDQPASSQGPARPSRGSHSRVKQRPPRPNGAVRRVQPSKKSRSRGNDQRLFNN